MKTMMDYRQQGQGQFFPGGGGFPGGGFPGGGFGGFNRRLEQVERDLQRVVRRLDQLDRRVDRIERRLGIRTDYDMYY
jgi:hypothetical protein